MKTTKAIVYRANGVRGIYGIIRVRLAREPPTAVPNRLLLTLDPIRLYEKDCSVIAVDI